MVLLNKTLSKYLLLTALFLGLTALSSTFTSASAESLMDTEKANRQLVLDFMDSIEALDMEQTKKLLAEDFSFQNGGGKRQFGGQTYADWWWSMVSTAKSLRPEVLRITVMGNTVLLENTFLYKDADSEMTFHGTKFFSIKDGKIKEYQEYRMPK